MQQATKKTLPPWLIIVIGAALIGTVVTIIYMTSRPPKVDYSALTLPEGIQQPVWMPTAPQSLKEIYAFAYQHQEELQYIPCYCGCAPGHKDNYECYWKRDENGALVYEEHAYG
jgi:hypothetical protein